MTPRTQDAFYIFFETVQYNLYINCGVSELVVRSLFHPYIYCRNPLSSRNRLAKRYLCKSNDDPWVTGGSLPVES